MRPLAIWVAAVAVVLGGFALVTTFTRSTEQVFVVVDTSFPMAAVRTKVPAALARIEDRDHAEFALATEKEEIHPFQSELDFTGTVFIAPCDLGMIESYPETAEADERILITTADSCSTDRLTDWTIVLLSP